MRAIRRIYVYLVSLVSLEVIVWGVIGLARTLVHQQQIGGRAADLAGSLALTLVGLPVFLLHWGMAQRSCARDLEEHADRVRGVFIYATLVSTLIPAVQNGMALVNRLLLALMRLPASSALVGSDQNAWDNAIAVVVNLVAAAYLFSVLRRDRSLPEALPGLNEVRRLFRVVWLLYGLGLTILGVNTLLTYIFMPAGELYPAQDAAPGNALTLLAAGLPLWMVTWRAMQAGLHQTGERESLLHWVVLYLLSLAGVGVVLTSAGLVLAVLLSRLMASTFAWSEVLSAIRQPLSLAVPLGGVWAYYGKILQQQIAETPDVQRRAGLRRLYYYILSAAGVGTVVSGLILLCGYLVRVLMKTTALQVVPVYTLANALAVLAVGLPLWLVAWRPMVAEANLDSDAGDHARRSPIRKAYLYLALFAGVIGAMVSAWGTLSPLFNAWFGVSQSHLGQDAVRNLSYLAIFLIFLAYHWTALRADGRAAAHALAQRQGRFNVLVIAPDEEFLQAVQSAVRQHAPHVPLTGVVLAQGAPEAAPGAFQAVVLPAALAVRPSPELLAWLDAFQGERLALPTPAGQWAWVGSGERTLREWADQTGHAVRLRAEGLPLRAAPVSSPWVVAGYVFGGLFALELLMFLASLLISTFVR